MVLINSASLILPGSTNITVATGDVAIAVYLGSGNWRVLSYTLASIPTKASPTGSDFVLIQDAAAGNAQKKSTVTSLRASTAPTRQIFTSSSGTYTTPANVIYIRVRM